MCHKSRVRASICSRFTALACPTVIGILWATGCGSGAESGPIGSDATGALGSTVVSDATSIETEWLDPADLTYASATLSFSASPVFCCNPLSIEFAAELSGDSGSRATTFEWDFGDDTAALGQAVRHTYSWPGEYLVVLTARLADGTELVHQRDLPLRIDGSGWDETLTVYAGRDQVVFGGDRVMLVGEVRGVGVEPAYVWRQVAGPTVDLAGALTLVASFDAPDPQGDTSWILDFELAVTDSDFLTSDTVRVTARPSSDLGTVNTPPIVFDQSISIRQGDSAALILSGSSPDGAELTFIVLAGPAPGALSPVVRTGPESATVTYTSDAGFVGTDSFTFRASDGTTISNTATFTIDVEATPEGLRGTSVNFVKWQEIETRNDDGSHPLPTAVAVANLMKYDAIWSANFIWRWNREVWTKLRSEHPDILALHYTSAMTTLPGTRGYFDNEDLTQNHPEWILDVRWSTDPGDEFFERRYLDVCDPDFQQWAAAHVVERASGEWESMPSAYDGVGLDNVQIGRQALTKITERHPDWKYANRRDEWNACFCEYLKLVKEALNERGFMLIVNHSLEYGTDADAATWNFFLDSIDGVITERAIGYDSEIYADEAWLMSIERHERILDKGLIDWWIGYPNAFWWGRPEDFLYNYCSWLLIKRPGQSLFFATRGDPGYWTNPVVHWYEEYDRPLGPPTTTRQLKDNCWVREYANALIVVNPTREIQSIEIGGGILQMPPMSGRILP